MSNESTALVSQKQTGMVRVGEQTLKPDKVIEAAIASGYFKHLKSPADGYIIAAYGASMGMDITTALSSIVLIGGKMTFTAGFIAALVKRSQKYNYKVKVKTDKACEIEFFEKVDRWSKDRGNYQEWESQGVEKFTIEDAKRANLIGKGPNWTSFPSAMCFARAMTAGVRTYCPDLLAGNSAYTPDELDPSIPMKMSDGDLVPDAEYTVSPSSPPKPQNDAVAVVRDLMAQTGTDEKTFLQDLLGKDSADKLTAAEQQKAVNILTTKKKAMPY